MHDASNGEQEVIAAYRQRAPRYDDTARLFDFFAWFGFNISGWRRQAVSLLALKPGDTVVDIGCGTGLNFPLLHRAVGPGGRIVGVDISEAMLAQASHICHSDDRLAMHFGMLREEWENKAWKQQQTPPNIGSTGRSLRSRR